MASSFVMAIIKMLPLLKQKETNQFPHKQTMETQNDAITNDPLVTFHALSVNIDI